jgi:hypothetical protein
MFRVVLVFRLYCFLISLILDNLNKTPVQGMRLAPGRRRQRPPILPPADGLAGTHNPYAVVAKSFNAFASPTAAPT